MLFFLMRNVGLSSLGRQVKIIQTTQTGSFNSSSKPVILTFIRLEWQSKFYHKNISITAYGNGFIIAQHCYRINACEVKAVTCFKRCSAIST